MQTAYYLPARCVSTCAQEINRDLGSAEDRHLTFIQKGLLRSSDFLHLILPIYYYCWILLLYFVLKSSISYLYFRYGRCYIIFEYLKDSSNRALFCQTLWIYSNSFLKNYGNTDFFFWFLFFDGGIKYFIAFFAGIRMSYDCRLFVFSPFIENDRINVTHITKRTNIIVYNRTMFYQRNELILISSTHIYNNGVIFLCYGDIWEP